MDRHRGVQGRQETRQGRGRPGQIRSPQQHVQTLICGTSGICEQETLCREDSVYKYLGPHSGKQNSKLSKQCSQIGSTML